MQINYLMPLTDLADRMSRDCLEPAEVVAMRDLLVAEFDGCDTRDVPEARWEQLVEIAAESRPAGYHCETHQSLHWSCCASAWHRLRGPSSRVGYATYGDALAAVSRALGRRHACRGHVRIVAR